jgi:exo-1,4-beta-D-glucosaminidase
MKNWFYCLVLFASLGCSAAPAGDMLGHWTLQREGDSRKFEVTVPSTVAGALNEAGFFGQDILDQDRYKNVDKSIFDDPWVYTTQFTTRKGMNHVLRFDGLNYYADIDLNGVRIASADTTFGTFCVREFDVTSLLKKKNNVLKVTVRRAHKGDLNHGYVDWNPRALDESMGIIRPVSLITTPDVEVKDLYVRPLVNPADLSSARLQISCTLVNRSDKAVEGELRAIWDDDAFSVPVKLAAGDSRKMERVITVSNPRIWWTREMGSPEMYQMEAAFCKDGKTSHSQTVRFGIRSIESEVDASGHRQFILNGKKVLIKAGGWTDDLFMQDTPASLKVQVEKVLDMGLNCIRFENIWGKDDTIYDLCDSMGVMALAGWSCQWEWEDYCGLPETRGYGCINNPASEALAVRYFRDQVIRLRNHPSLIGWMTGSDRIPNPRLEEQYLALYKDLDYRPYVCSAKGLTSLAGPSGMKMEGPYEYVGPDYWYVDTTMGGAFGFNTETGPGLNMVQEESLRRMVGEKDLWPIGPNWAYHCTASSSHMNNTSFIEKVMEGVYGKAENLDDFIRKAHALDYDATRSMFEAFRCNVPRATGIVMWMLNSAWPSLYWQMYDWYGVPTAGYYGVKQGNAPVQLVYNYANHTVYAVNDAVEADVWKATLKVYDPQSRLVREESRELTVAPREPRKVFENIQGPCFVYLEMSRGDETVTNFYCVAKGGNSYDWDNADWWGIPLTGYADLSFVSALPAVQLDMQVQKTADGYTVTLENKSETISYQNILKAVGADGNLVPDALWSENFLTLLPGQRRTVRCTLPGGAKNVTIGLKGWNSSVK